LGGGFQLKANLQRAVIVENDSPYHRAKLAQGDQGTDPGW